MKIHFIIDIVNARRLHSISNGQVEKLHNTSTEIAGCLMLDRCLEDIEVILLVTIKYNKSVHTVTGKNLFQSAQQKDTALRNEIRQNHAYEIGEKILIKTNKL